MADQWPVTSAQSLPGKDASLLAIAWDRGFWSVRARGGAELSRLELYGGIGGGLVVRL